MKLIEELRTRWRLLKPGPGGNRARDAATLAPELCQDFQINLPSNPIKRWAKVSLGQALIALLPARPKQLQQGQRPPTIRAA
jgi:hypothetical protein